ncbi:MAG: Sjogren's syndrome/scleroderma autoantigen 1 family protein [Conexivisphaerales archaeon]
MDKASQKLVVEFMKRGATLLKEPCPKCGGIMLRYRGVEFCPVDSGITSVQQLEEQTKPAADVYEEMLGVVNDKLGQLKLQLKDCNDLNQLSVILDDIKKLLEISSLLKSKPS